MPTYVYECRSGCSKRIEAVRRIAERADAPACQCGSATDLRITPTMVSVFSPYRAVAEDKESGKRPVIRSKAEHEAFLRRNGYEEVGNDASMAPRLPEEIAARRAELQRAQESTTFDFDPDTQTAQQEAAP